MRDVLIQDGNAGKKAEKRAAGSCEEFRLWLRMNPDKRGLLNSNLRRGSEGLVRPQMKSRFRELAKVVTRVLMSLSDTIRRRKGGLTTGRRLATCPTRLTTCSALAIVLACCPYASALDPSLDVSQYAHTPWRIRDGFTKGIIRAIAQTPDGYLWLGTEFGLLRFDGIRNELWQPPAGEELPSSQISSLHAASDGRLWIGTRQGLASWKDGKLTLYPELAGQEIHVLEDHEHTIWAGAYYPPPGRLCAIRSGNVQCFGQDGEFGASVVPEYEDHTGYLWVGAGSGLWRWKPGTPRRYPLPDMVSTQNVLESENGVILIAVRAGIKQLVRDKIAEYPFPGGLRFQPLRMIRDRDGGLWIGTLDRGLLHFHHGRVDVFSQSDGLSGNWVRNLFEDREGNIWVATDNGLDRFRDLAVSTFFLRHGRSQARPWSLLAAKDGSVWVGTPDGLNRLMDGQVTVYRKRSGLGRRRSTEPAGTGTRIPESMGFGTPNRAFEAAREIADAGLPDDSIQSLFQDDRQRVWVSTAAGIAYFEKGQFIPVIGIPQRVHGITEDAAGNIWISQEQSLYRLQGGRVRERFPWTNLGRKTGADVMLFDLLRGGLWLGFQDGTGIAYLKDGGIRDSYATAQGLGKGTVGGLQLDSDGTLWASTGGGLSRLKDGRIDTLTAKSGLPCNSVSWTIEDGDHCFWLYTACGLVRIARAELEAWGTAVDKDKDTNLRIQVTVFDNSDGVRSQALPWDYTPQAGRSPDGRLWFLPGDGVSVVDPRHLPFNKLPPPVHIEQIVADRKTYEACLNRRLPALTRDLEIEYTALSLVAPEKNRFRVKLEGRDPDWKDVANERKAFYTDLPPGHYRFRVMASNNSGVWNEAGDTLDFSIDSAYYQTTWFRASCGAAFLSLLWALYRYRLHQIAQEFNMRLEERVGERTRIARDLHDTLLQSFQGLMLRFQVIDELLPARPAEAKEALEKALERGDQAIIEGRDAVHDLRSSTVIKNDLAEAVQTLGDEVSAATSAPHPVKFRVVVEGSPRILHPILRDEIYHIASEAVRNAFSHARAHKIEAEITYGGRLLRLRIRDDGSGMDSRIVEEGRAGHYGLPGMRERAARIGGQLSVWTRAGTGTEIELSIPGSIAYGRSAARWWRWLRPEKALHTRKRNDRPS